jgi:Nitrous oxide-stimulated promoter
MDNLTTRQQKDMKILISFVSLFCRSRHSGVLTAPLDPALTRIAGKEQLLCPECRELVGYAAKRLRFCPLEPKPSCKRCHVHCYRPDYRVKVREVMAWSGKRLILRGRLDLLLHYFF